jgi:hypothetical protein
VLVSNRALCYQIAIVSETFNPSMVPTPSRTSSHSDLLEELKQQLAAPLFTAVSSKLDSYQNRLQYAELKIRVLEERLRQQRIAKVRSGQREALALLTTFIGSGHVNTRKMLEVEATGRRYQIPPHEFIRAVMYGDFVHFDPSRSAIANMFDISSADGREHFLLPLVIGVLDRSAALRGMDGFVETSYLYDSLQSMGFTPDQIDFAVSRGIDKKLIQTSGRQIPADADDMPSSMRVTSSGLYHAYRLTSNFQYIDAMMIDTPILDDSVREKIRSVEDIGDRLTRAEVFVNDYLDGMWSSLSALAIGFDWAEMSESGQQESQAIRWRLLNKPRFVRCGR